MIRKNVFSKRNTYPTIICSEREKYVNDVPCEVIYTSGNFKFRYVPEWAKWPDELWGYMVSGITVDKQDNVYAAVRCEKAPICKFDKDGNFICAMGEDMPVSRLHGLSIAADQSLWAADDANHVIHHIASDGRYLGSLGKLKQPSDTGYDPDYVSPDDQTEPCLITYIDDAGKQQFKKVSNSCYLSISRLGERRPVRIASR